MSKKQGGVSMQDDSSVAQVVILVLQIFIMLLVLFGFWGGYPKGLFTIATELDERVSKLENNSTTLIDHRHTGIYGLVDRK